MVTSGGSATADSAIRSYLAAQSSAFLAHLPRLRQGRPDAAHRMRVACRRTRSTLRTFAELVDEEWALELSAELQYLAGVLAAERDLEVVRERLVAAIDETSDRPGDIRARTLIDRSLRREQAVAHDNALKSIASPRAHALADQMAVLSRGAVLTASAAQPAREALPPLIDGAFTRLAKRVESLGDPLGGPPDAAKRKRRKDAPPPAPADESWHRARISAKRLRYAAELAAPEFGDPAERFARLLSDATELLGAQQDAVVASAVIERLADTPRIAPATCFALGRLQGAQQVAVVRSRIAFAPLWDEITSAQARAWLDG